MSRLIEPTTAPTNIALWLRAHYQRILKERGLQYEARRGYVRHMFPVLWGIVQHLVEAESVIGVHKDEYIYQWAGISWECVAFFAQKIAPDQDKAVYSPSFCVGKALHDPYTFQTLLAYRPNFDALLGNFVLALLSGHLLIVFRYYRPTGGL